VCKVRAARLAEMDRARVALDVSSGRARTAFAASRARAIERLRMAGVPMWTAEPLVDEWLRSTEMLPDFVAAPDYWDVAYQFAVEEYRRRAEAAGRNRRTTG
jgi:hypothetical protein